MPLNFLTLFLTFLQAGRLCIGDGYATIVPLRRAIVKKNSWMTDDDFSRHIAIVQTMPGVFNVNLANYFGKQLMGWKGSTACIMGMILPPLFLFLLFSTFYNELVGLSWVQSFMRGARPAIVALIALPCLQMWRNSSITLSTIWIPIGAAIAIGLLGISPSYIIIGLIVLAALYAIFVQTTNDSEQ